jgi:nitroreductase
MNTIHNIEKQAVTSVPIHQVLADRWSPRAFEKKSIDDLTLRSLLEAARWAPSAMNEQPWRFLYAHRGEPAFDQILETFAESNKIWAQNAATLMITLAKRSYTVSGQHNRSAQYDLGQAVAHLSVQATHLGIGVHQIGGFYPEKARQLFEVSEDYEVVTGLVLGYFGSPDSLPPPLQQRELAPRKRKELQEISFHADLTLLKSSN